MLQVWGILEVSVAQGFSVGVQKGNIVVLREVFAEFIDIDRFIDKGEALKEHISCLDIATPVCYVENPIYHKTNNIYSLMLAQDYLLKEDTLLLESDIIFEENVIRKLLEDYCLHPSFLSDSVT